MYVVVQYFLIPPCWCTGYFFPKHRPNFRLSSGATMHGLEYREKLSLHTMANIVLLPSLTTLRYVLIAIPRECDLYHDIDICLFLVSRLTPTQFHAKPNITWTHLRLNCYNSTGGSPHSYPYSFVIYYDLLSAVVLHNVLNRHINLDWLFLVLRSEPCTRCPSIGGT